MHRNSPHVRFIIIYDKIPESIKAEEKHHMFKRKLKNLLTGKAYYTINDFLNDNNFTRDFNFQL